MSIIIIIFFFFFFLHQYSKLFFLIQYSKLFFFLSFFLLPINYVKVNVSFFSLSLSTIARTFFPVLIFPFPSNCV